MTLLARSRAAFLILTLAAFGLSACGGFLREAPTPQPPPASAKAQLRVKLPLEKPEPPAKTSAYSLETARPFPPENLTGLSQQEARVLFGPPSIISQEPPAEVWRYAYSPECLLVLFFYLDVSASAWRVLTYEVELKAGDDAKCIGALYERHAASN